MRELTIILATTALFFSACGDDNGSNGGNGTESTVSVTSEGETYVLEGMAITGNGGFQVDGLQSDTHDAHWHMVCNDLGALVAQ